MQFMNKLRKENIKADLESINLLLKNEKYRGYCEYLSPVSPINNSTKIIRHYKFVHGFSMYKIAIVQYLTLKAMEKASGGTEISDSFKKNPPLQMELLLSHYELKKKILDNLVNQIPVLPVKHKIIKRSIHKTLYSQYRSVFSWILGFIGIS